MSKIRNISAIACIFSLVCIAAIFSVPVKAENIRVSEDEENIIIYENNYNIKITKANFKYGFSDGKGEQIVDPHPVSGLLISESNGSAMYDAETTQLIDYNSEKVHLQITMENGMTTDVYIYPKETFAQFKILPSDEEKGDNWKYVTDSSGASLSILENYDWEDYVVEATIDIDREMNESASGLVFGYQDDDNFFHFRVHGREGLQLVKWSGGSADVIETVEDVPVEAGSYDLKVEVVGHDITCYLNGEKKIEIADSSITSGTAGIRVWRDKISLNHLTVKDLEDDVLFEDDFTDGKKEAWSERAGNWRVIDPKARLLTRTFDVRTAGLDPVYGMGDYGAHADEYTPGTPAQGRINTRPDANLLGLVREDITNRGSNMRFISNFTVFPKHNMAQVMFEEGEKRVAFTEEENRLGASGVEEIGRLYYFFGDMEQIYGDYKIARENEGFRDARPKPEMFGVGWEAYGALGWDTYQSSVMDTLEEFMDRGYRFYWGVIGSGFWRGPRGSDYEGTTTSFGLWDEEPESGRSDGFPNPRYPDVEGLKDFFAENDINMILGLRNHFKAPRSEGGYYTPRYEGPYPKEGLENDYYLKDENGHPLLVRRAAFPSGNIYLLDSRNEEALDWFIDGVDKWEVQGFKKDAMLYMDTFHDANWNPLNERLMEENYKVIVRNSAYSAPGDLLRINDTMYGDGSRFHGDPDRIPVNLLSFAASGMSHLYPDITGGTPGRISPTSSSYRSYYVRNAVLNALCPSMSLGTPPWALEHETSEQIVKNAVEWHNRHVPYIYSAVLDWYETGYPHAMTPLHIAYPNDPNTHQLINMSTRQYQWMLGPSLMATPVFGRDFETAESRDVYLPEGKWIDYETGEVFHGPTTLEDYSLPKDKMPIFVGGKGVIVTGDLDGGDLTATVYPVATEDSQYTYNHFDGEKNSTITNLNTEWDPENIQINDVSTGEEVDFAYDSDMGSFSFVLTPGNDYEITD